MKAAHSDRQPEPVKLPRPQILFDTAESITSPGPARQVEPELKAMSLSVASWDAEEADW